jgi:hypothetical protein
MVFNAIFNNISVISWQSVLLVEETGGPKKTTDLSQVTAKIYHIMLFTLSWLRFELTTSVVIGIDCIGSCKSNYPTITATMVPIKICIMLKLILKSCFHKKGSNKRLKTRDESVHCSIKKREKIYTVPHNIYFLAVWTKFDTFYFQIFYWKKKGNLLIKGKLSSLQDNCKATWPFWMIGRITCSSIFNWLR